MSRALMVVAFYANQNLISTTLCENRNQPAKHCKGKCYLNKQLKQDDKKDKHALPFSANEIFQEFIATTAIHIPTLLVFSTHLEKPVGFYSFHYSSAYFSEIPHPPSA